MITILFHVCTKLYLISIDNPTFFDAENIDIFRYVILVLQVRFIIEIRAQRKKFPTVFF